MKTSRNPALLRAFAAELKARRVALGLNQEGLAFEAGLNRTFIAKLEVASTSPSLTSLIRLAEGLQVDPVELVKSLMKRYKKELLLQIG
jgi:transcriptional regulator with XRE-family HTH domain